MKRLTTIFLLVAAFVLAACTNDDSLTAQSGEVVTMSYTVALPDDIGTRSYSDGETAVYLSYGVYEAGTKNLVLSEERAAIIANKAATVEMQLLKGSTYDIVFWADAGKNSNYTIDFNAQTVSMNYTDGMDANDESRDAFWAVKEKVEASASASSTDVTLYRPFAQLNFGTDDLSAKIIRQNYSIPSTVFTLTMPKGSLAQTFSLKDGSVSDATTSDITFTYTGIPAASDGEFPISGYEYLQMNYLLPYNSDDATATTLVGDDDDPVTLTVALSDDVQPTVSVTNMPLQRNYRTNVYGSLLTNPMVFTISIDNDYADHYCIKNGVPYYCVETEESFLEALAAGEDIIMLDDITLTESEITISSETAIDLNGYTLTIEASNEQDGWINVYNGLTITNGTLVNIGMIYYVFEDATLTMDNVTLMTYGTTSGAVGIWYYSTSTESTITNSTIIVTHDKNQSVAVMNTGAGTITIVKCDITASGSSNATGGAYNESTGTIKIDDCTITVTEIEQGQCTWIYGANNIGAGTITIENSTVTVTAIGTNEAEQVYGVCNDTYYSGTITIENSTITATNENGNAYDVYNAGNGKITIVNSIVESIYKNGTGGAITIDGEEATNTVE